MTSTRKMPTRAELGVWRDYIETTQLLQATLAARLVDLSPADYAVLLALSEAPRSRSSDLAAAMGWERSRLSHHLPRMERRGLLTREDCPTDSRGAEVVLTAAGAAAFRRASIPHLRDIRELFLDALTPEQLEAVAGITAALRTRLR